MWHCSWRRTGIVIQGKKTLNVITKTFVKDSTGKKYVNKKNASITDRDGIPNRETL